MELGIEATKSATHQTSQIVPFFPCIVDEPSESQSRQEVVAVKPKVLGIGTHKELASEYPPILLYMILSVHSLSMQCIIIIAPNNRFAIHAC